MEAIKYLIGFFFKLAFGAIFIALVWWLVALLFPSLSLPQVKQLISNNQKKDILPSPKSYAKLFKPVTTPYSDVTPGVYGTQFNGYGNVDNNNMFLNGTAGNFVTYSNTDGGTVTNNGQVVQPSSQSNVVPSRSLYVRNLSIYEGGNISANLTFIGEARSDMYQNGAFPVLVVNQQGRILGVSYARATGAWAIPGWSRFEVNISHALPPGGVPCAVVFEQARIPGNTNQPVRVGIPVKCN